MSKQASLPGSPHLLLLRRLLRSRGLLSRLLSCCRRFSRTSSTRGSSHLLLHLSQGALHHQSRQQLCCVHSLPSLSSHA